MVTELNKENFEKEVNQADTPVIIDFWASWCRPCLMMGPVFEELSKEYEGKLKFAKVSTEEQPDLAGQFNVMSIPTLVMVKEGKETGRFSGFMPKDALKEKIDGML